MHRDGRNGQRLRWGDFHPGAIIGFERTVSLYVFADRIVVEDEPAIRVGRGESREELLKDVLTAVNEHVKSWGKPPEKFYWIPALRFVVSPGGNQHYERLHGPLNRWGLSTTAEFTLNTDQR